MLTQSCRFGWRTPILSSTYFMLKVFANSYYMYVYISQEKQASKLIYFPSPKMLLWNYKN